MAVVVILLLAVGALVVIYALRNVRGTNPLLVSTRMGRYGLVVPVDSEEPTAAVNAIVSPTRERQQQSAVSQSVEKILGRGRLGTAVFVRLERAHLRITPGEFISLSIAIFMGGMAGGLLIRGIVGLLIFGIIGAVAPWIYLARRISKRRKQFLEQLADMAQMIANSMKAGFSILQSVELIAHEAVAPASEEFERVVTEVKLGLSLEAALEHLKERMPSEDIELMVVAISVQRVIGGNLSEILMVISQTIRERVRFQRDLRTLTAQARYSSYVITALPVAVGIAINLLDTQYESYLYTNLLGNIMIGTAIVMLALGFFFLNRIASIEV